MGLVIVWRSFGCKNTLESVIIVLIRESNVEDVVDIIYLNCGVLSWQTRHNFDTPPFINYRRYFVCLKFQLVRLLK